MGMVSSWYCTLSLIASLPVPTPVEMTIPGSGIRELFAYIEGLGIIKTDVEVTALVTRLLLERLSQLRGDVYHVYTLQYGAYLIIPLNWYGSHTLTSRFYVLSYQ